ncbi:MAG TPA: hypothetical protein VMU68_13155 [Acidimicrobiales bacterium]|nr:hypothetical protein [Acidimicrobiales bacterium]
MSDELLDDAPLESEDPLVVEVLDWLSVDVLEAGVVDEPSPDVLVVDALVLVDPSLLLPLLDWLSLETLLAPATSVASPISDSISDVEVGVMTVGTIPGGTTTGALTGGVTGGGVLWLSAKFTERTTSLLCCTCTTYVEPFGATIRMSYTGTPASTSATVLSTLAVAEPESLTLT